MEKKNIFCTTKFLFILLSNLINNEQNGFYSFSEMIYEKTEILIRKNN